MGNLSNLYISQSFQSLIHLGTNNTASAALIDLQDGYGNNIGVAVNTAGDLFLSGSLTASLQNGYIYVGGANGKTKAFATSSLVATVDTGSLVTTASFNSYTQSTNIRLNNLESTSASVNVSISNLNSTTSSFATSISNLNSATQSLQSQLATIGGQSGSWITESETGSFARYDVSNPWSANQTFTNITATSASFTYLTTLYETASVIYSSGSNQLGDELTDIQTLSGSVKIQGGLTINGLDVTGSLNNLNAFTSSANIRLNNLETTSASVNVSISNLNASSASQQISIDNINLATASFSTIVNGLSAKTGSYATTGSNTFIGNETFQDAGGNASTLVPTSGSLMLVAKSFTSASAHLSASTSTSVNLIFKNSDVTADTIISGSNNIFTNPAAPTAGFKRYIGGSSNIAMNASAVPQISASMGFSPTMGNNYFGGTAGMIMRGPVSSSAWAINNNILNNTTAFAIGTAAATDAKQIVSGLTMANNIGNVFANIQAYKTPLSASFTYSTSTGAGVVNINLHSSSLNYGGNIAYGGTTINNLYFPTTVDSVSGLVTINSCQFLGTSNIIFSGSNTSMTGETRRLQSSLIVGFNSASLVLNGDSGSLLATSILGAGLSVTGSNSRFTTLNIPNNDHGSVFVGRYNDQSGNKALSAQTVFAVGTGTANATANRKTGFLIDSGSNSYFEGTLNVSGSTLLTGSLYIPSGSWIPSATGSSVLTWNSATGQVSQSPIATLISSSFSVGAFNSTVTQSGSAAVSQSMTFNNTDIANGVSIVSNSRITIANSGTYNIQFSAQLLAPTGADTIWIWLKKNGTNVSNTGTKLVLANNEADVAAWNFVVPAIASDYFELVWQNNGGHTQLLTEAAAGNYPAIPSIIVTVTQVE